jgi:hypothetical protein
MKLIPRLEAPAIMRPPRKAETVILAGAGLVWLAKVARSRGQPVEHVNGHYDAIAAVADDPAGYGLVVQHCDDLAGLERGHKSAFLLRSIAPRVAVMLLVGQDAGGPQGAMVRRSGAQVMCWHDKRQIVEHVLARTGGVRRTPWDDAP